MTHSKTLGVFHMLIVAAAALGLALALYAVAQSQPQTQRGAPQAQAPQQAQNPATKIPKRPLPKEAIPGVGWMYSLFWLYQKSGVYNGLWFDQSDVYKNAAQSWASVSAAATGQYLQAVAGIVSSILEAVEIPGRLSREYWQSFNIASAYIEKVGPPPTSAWVMQAALSGTKAPLSPYYSEGDTWAPTAGHTIAQRILETLQRLDKEGYELPKEPEIWSVARIRGQGLSVVNDGEAFRPSGRYPFAVNAYLASYQTALTAYIPNAEMRKNIAFTGRVPWEHFREVVGARRERMGDAGWYRLDETGAWWLVWNLKRGTSKEARLEPPDNGASSFVASAEKALVGGGMALQKPPIRSIIPTLISFEVENAVGQLAVSIPEEERRRYLLWYTNPGGGWMNTHYPAPSRWWVT